MIKIRIGELPKQPGNRLEVTRPTWGKLHLINDTTRRQLIMVGTAKGYSNFHTYVVTLDPGKEEFLPLAPIEKVTDDYMHFQVQTREVTTEGNVSKVNPRRKQGELLHVVLQRKRKVR